MAAPANKIAMSKALGAAFLNHQVEQLEKTVGGGGHWGNRDRERGAKRGGGGGPREKFGPEIVTKAIPIKAGVHDTGRLSGEDTDSEKTKDADIIIADASVLVNALDQLKKWCRNGRQEIVIVPLEALNTMDMLKKGSTPLAQRAREASRILEAQVGTNPRIRVQQDDAYVPWDKISFLAAPATPEASPEWLRRTICSARWEMEHAGDTLNKTAYKVILATCASPPTAAPLVPSIPDRSNGALVAYWGKRAGINVVELKAAPHGHGRRTSSEDKDKRSPRPHGSPRREREKGLVERPPTATIEPTKVIRVLARGEKLEPDP